MGSATCRTLFKEKIMNYITHESEKNFYVCLGEKKTSFYGYYLKWNKIFLYLHRK